MPIMSSKPTPPIQSSNGRKVYWKSWWYDEDGGHRSKTFGRVDEVTEAQANIKYKRFMADWHVGNHRKNDEVPLLSAVICQYNAYADGHYRDEKGVPTGEAATIKGALKLLDEMFGSLPAENLSGPHIRKVSAEQAARGATRQTVNAYMARIRRMARWGVSQDLLPPEVLTKVESVQAIRSGTTGYEEADEVVAVPELYIPPVIAELAPTIADMVELQLHTGMRPGEMVKMRPIDIDTSSTPWKYRPDSHKNSRRGKSRVVPLGPQARRIVQKYLNREATKPLFVPQEVQDARMEAKREAYTPPPGAQGDYRRWKSSEARRKKKTGHPGYGESYTTTSYRRAIERACKRADVPAWTPGQLRHNAEQRIERHYLDHGVSLAEARDAARVVLGHARIETTAIYASRDEAEAAKVMEVCG